MAAASRTDFIYDNGTYTTIDDPFGIEGTTLAAINASGEAAGTYTDGSGNVHGFVYANGTYTTIDDPLGVNGTSVTAINASGEIAGFYVDASGNQHGFVENNGVFSDVDNSLGVSTNAVIINDVGQVAGVYFDNNGNTHDFLATPDTATCYCRSTRIGTERGEVPVEDLEIGDRVVTMSGAVRPIKWIGRRSYSGRFALGKKHLLPICIKAGAIAENVPRRDLWISPHHAMYLEGLLIEARNLVNGVTVVQTDRVDRIEYFHIELEVHDVIIAEGALSETFIDDDSRGMFHNAHEYATLYPHPPSACARYCAPRHDDGYEVEAARRRIDARAGIRSSTEEHKLTLRGFVDVVTSRRISGWAQTVEHPEAPTCLNIYAGGQLIGRALANRYREDLKRAGLGSGRHSFEFTPPAGLEFAPLAVEVRRTFDGALLEPSTNLQRARTSYLERKDAGGRRG